MAFMIPEYTVKTTMYRVSINGEAQLIEDRGDVAQEVRDALQVDAQTHIEIEPEHGYWAQLSAPGYMDCTGWSGPYDSLDEAREFIRDTYEVDPDTGDALEERDTVYP